MYVKLMTRLKDTNVSVLEWTPLASERAMISVGNSSLEELDWAIWDDIMLPKSMSIFITIPYIKWAWSIFKSEVWDVRARLK